LILDHLDGLVRADAPEPHAALTSTTRSRTMLSANLMNEQLARSRHAELLSEADQRRLVHRARARQRLRRKVQRAERAALRARLALSSL
jgi:hypothetical protein